MKFCFYMIIFVSAIVVSHADRQNPLWKRVKLYAVTYFDGIEAFYKSLFTKVKFRQTGKNPKQPDKCTMNLLCKNIFTNAFFRSIQEKWVNADSRGIRVALKKEREDVFETMYRKLERQSTSMMLRGDDYEYVNAYRRRKISIDKEEEFEFTFTCLVRNQKSNQLKEYFVSPTYNINSLTTAQSAIAGRFIFAYDEHKRLVLRALAEESTKIAVKYRRRNRYKKELSYFKLRKPLSEIGPNDTITALEDDPVCQLTPGEKLRLCATAMASTKLRKKVVFLSAMSNVQINCETRPISFRSKVWQKIANENFFEEQMIGCKTYDKDNQLLMYYISRGYAGNHIIVYKFHDDKVFIENLMRRASVIQR